MPQAPATRRSWNRARRRIFRNRGSCACDPASNQYRREAAVKRKSPGAREENSFHQIFSVHPDAVRGSVSATLAKMEMAVSGQKVLKSSRLARIGDVSARYFS